MTQDENAQLRALRLYSGLIYCTVYVGFYLETKRAHCEEFIHTIQ